MQREKELLGFGRNRFSRLMRRTVWRIFPAIAILTGCATAPVIPEEALELGGAPVMVEESGEAEIVVAIDATSEEAWAYFDLDSAEIVKVEDPFTESTWDLAFQRFRVKSNGGVSGNSDVAVAAIGSDDFSLSVEIDSIEWRTDSGDGNQIDYAFTADGNWYKYNFRNHSLESLRQLMVVRSGEGIVYRLQMLTYYDQLLLSGYPTFRYVKL